METARCDSLRHPNQPQRTLSRYLVASFLLAISISNSRRADRAQTEIKDRE